MPDSWKITNALVTKLQTDAELKALLPDGAWHAEAPPNATRFAIVALIPPMRNIRKFGGVAHKDALYLVEARVLSTAGGPATAQAAAARFGTLLDPQGQGGDLAIDGYAVVAGSMHFEEDVEAVEVDEVTPSIRWHRCGGHLRLMAAPA